jgi:hypothetical protein
VFDDYVAVVYKDNVELSPRPFDFNTPLGLFAQHYFYKHKHARQYAQVAVSSWAAADQPSARCSVRNDNSYLDKDLHIGAYSDIIKPAEQSDSSSSSSGGVVGVISAGMQHIKDMATGSNPFGSKETSSDPEQRHHSPSNTQPKSSGKSSKGDAIWDSGGYRYKRVNGVLYRKKIP